MSETKKKSREVGVKYLLFTLGGDLFGTPLLGVREVIEPQRTRPVPNTLNHFLGVTTLRGEIVGVIDLRRRFGRDPREMDTNALMVFEIDDGSVAALVDEVTSVTNIPEKLLDRKPNIHSTIPSDYLIGVAQTKGRLVNIIDLMNVLKVEQIQLSNTRSMLPITGDSRNDTKTS